MPFLSKWTPNGKDDQWWENEHCRNGPEADEGAGEEYTDPWEGFKGGDRKKSTRKILKPMEIKNWFADEPRDSTEPSTDSTGPDENWTEVERKRRNTQKRRKRRAKKLSRMEEIASKIQHMIGVGPIPRSSVEFFAEESESKDEAMKKAIKEYLSCYLQFDREEIEDLNILETKQCNSREDILYFVAEDKDTMKEIHFRRAVSGQDDLVVRDYIPPQYHARYMAVSRRAADKRGDDNLLKTQIRWGKRDIEVFTKTKGTNEQFKRTNLKEFMGPVFLPDFDMDVEWKVNKGDKPRRKLVKEGIKTVPPSLRGRQAPGKEKPAEPSTQKELSVQPVNDKAVLVRQLSNTSRGTTAKKPRQVETSSESSGSSAEEEMEVSELPASRKNDEVEEDEQL